MIKYIMLNRLEQPYLLGDPFPSIIRGDIGGGAGSDMPTIVIGDDEQQKQQTQKPTAPERPKLR